MHGIHEPIRWLVMVAIGIGIGLAAAVWHQQRRAEAQPLGSQWEYKVVVFQHAGDYRTDPDGRHNADKFTTQLSALAAERWEYVGLVVNPSSYSRGYVAFKRLKK
jgi:hypothetical protein